MAEIIVDPECSEEDREHATDTMVEALLPGITADVLECQERLMRSPEAMRVRQEMDQEEASFAENLRHCMEEKGLTQEELARKARVGQPAISNMLNRQCRPQRRTVLRFAEALGVAPDELWPSPGE